MRRPLNITQALTFPFEHDNWVPGLVYVSLVLLVYFIISYVVGLVMGLGLYVVFGENVPQVASVGLNLGVSTLLSLVFMSFMNGYYWRLIDMWHRGEYEAPAPTWDWTGQWGEGLVLVIYNLLITLPMVVVYLAFVAFENIFILGGMLLLLIGYFFLGPFLFAPVVQGADRRNLSGLLDLGAAMELGARNYLRALWAMVLIGMLTLVAIPLYLLGCCFCLVGSLPVMAYHYLVCFHLMTQAFDDQTRVATMPQEVNL